MPTLLVDDSPHFLLSARRFLATQPIEVVGEARSGREALTLAESLRPELILLDVHMPDLDGLAVLRQVKARPDAPFVIMVTLHDLDEYRTAAFAAGADGFVTKREFSAALPPLIRRLAGPA